MFSEWLQSQKGISWNQLLQALRNIQLIALADELEQKLPGTGKVYSIVSIRNIM